MKHLIEIQKTVAKGNNTEDESTPKMEEANKTDAKKLLEELKLLIP
jgi:hypothetical protein